MDRITRKNLEDLVNQINEVTNSPIKPWTKNETGKYKSNIGNYHLSGAYGGVNLLRMVNEVGGVATTFSSGHIPKRDLYNRMRAFLFGLK